MPEALDVFLPQLALELPIPDCLSDNFAGRRVLARLDGGPKRSELFVRAILTFWTSGMTASLMLGRSRYCYLVAILSRASTPKICSARRSGGFLPRVDLVTHAKQPGPLLAKDCHKSRDSGGGVLNLPAAISNSQARIS
jgi:hypothetical protein